MCELAKSQLHMCLIKYHVWEKYKIRYKRI